MSTKNHSMDGPGRELSDEQIKTILLASGYTIKPGLTDLKPYVYAGARALLSAAPQPPAIQPEPMAWSYPIDPPEGFAAYVAANYSETVEFSDPAWHAKRLWNAAMRDCKTAPAQPVVRVERADNQDGFVFAEIDGRMKFLRIGDLIYSAPQPPAQPAGDAVMLSAPPAAWWKMFGRDVAVQQGSSFAAEDALAMGWRALCFTEDALAALAAKDAELADAQKRIKRLDAEANQIMQERDDAHKWGTKLAEAVSEHFRVSVGEHSSANDPRCEALAILNGEYVTDSDADRKQAVSAQLIRNLEARNAGLAIDLASMSCERDKWSAKWSAIRKELAELKFPGMRNKVAANNTARQHLPAHAPALSAIAAGKLAELQAKGFSVTGYAIGKTEASGQVTRGFVTTAGLVGWWVPDAGAQAGPVLLTKNQIHLALDAAGVMPDGLTLEREVKAARAVESAVHAANPALEQQHTRYRWLLARLVETLLNGPNPASWGVCVDAEKIAEADAIVAKAVGQEGGAS